MSSAELLDNCIGEIIVLKAALSEQHVVKLYSDSKLIYLYNKTMYCVRCDIGLSLVTPAYSSFFVCVCVK